MSLVEFESIPNTPLSTVVDKLNEVRYDPTLLIQRSLDLVESLTDGKTYIADPTHPAVNILEMGCVMAANNLQENIALLRRQYPIIAETADDLYLHMSDVDYLNRFASASSAKFYFTMPLIELQQKLVYDPAEKCYKAIIPRDTSISVDSIPFTLIYPIVIRRFENGVVQVSYDGAVESPVQNLKSNLIEIQTRTHYSGDTWVFFQFEAIQTKISSVSTVIDKVYNFKTKLTYRDSYYFARVFYRNSLTSNSWVEISTTHTDQVFDLNKVTAVLSVDDYAKELTVSIPVIYLTKEMITGEIRIDVYTTRGNININMGTYSPEVYDVRMEPIDIDRDSSQFTQIFSEINYQVFSQDIVNSGKSAITREALQERVVYNATGEQVIPITNVQLPASAQNKGFELALNVDVLTNRIFLATRKLPTPSNEKLVTSANIGNATIATLVTDLLENENVVINPTRYTLLANALIKSENGKLRILRAHEVSALRAMNQTTMVAELNSGSYYYSPFYYVFDKLDNSFETRAYSLNLPYAKELDFIRQNQSLQVIVNVDTYQLEKTSYGYLMTVTTRSGNNYKNIDDSQVGIQLAVQPEGETTYAYINGEQVAKTATGERVFQIKIETNYDIDDKDRIAITNASIRGLPSYRTWVSLEKKVSLIHHTSSINAGFVADETDSILGKFILPVNSVANTLEEVICHFGDALSELWTRSHSYRYDTVYKHYTEDIQDVWKENVYEHDPATGRDFFIDADGNVEFRIKHAAGSLVFDEAGQPVYKHRIGDIVVDELNQPVVETSVTDGRDFDILITDGRYLFADDEATVGYRAEIESTLVDWIVNNIDDITKNLLDQTKVYFFPKTTLGEIKIFIENGGEDVIAAEQNFSLQLHVRGSIYRDLDIREKLRRLTVTLLDEMIGSSIINMTEIRKRLAEAYGDSVVAFTISGLGGSKNYELISMVSTWQRLCLKKIIVIEANRTMTVQDAVDIDFKLSV